MSDKRQIHRIAVFRGPTINGGEWEVIVKTTGPLKGSMESLAAWLEQKTVKFNCPFNTMVSSSEHTSEKL